MTRPSAYLPLITSIASLLLVLEHIHNLRVFNFNETQACHWTTGFDQTVMNCNLQKDHAHFGIIQNLGK